MVTSLDTRTLGRGVPNGSAGKTDEVDAEDDEAPPEWTGRLICIWACKVSKSRWVKDALIYCWLNS